jgi:hypothetical protein
MPRYQWQGRDGAGQTKQGTVTAGDKNEALDRIRAEHDVMVSMLTEAGDDGWSAAPKKLPRRGRAALAVRLQQPRLPRAPRKPRPFRGLLIAAAFAGLGVAAGLLEPAVVYRCERDGTGVACSITRRLLALYPLSTQGLAGVDAVEVERTSQRATFQGRPVEQSMTRIVFRSGARSIRPDHWFYGNITTARDRRTQTPDTMAREFSDFVADPSRTTLTRRELNPMPFILAGVLFLLAGGTLVLSVMAFVLGGALMQRAEAMAAAARERGDRR